MIRRVARFRFVTARLVVLVFALVLVPLLVPGLLSAKDCPPGDVNDCAAAAELARNPLVPLAAATLGAIAGTRRRKQDGDGQRDVFTRPPAPPPPDDDYDERIERATGLQREIDEREAWLDKLRRDREGFRDHHRWESDYDERLQQLEQDIESEERTLSRLRGRLDELDVPPGQIERDGYVYNDRYHEHDEANRERRRQEAIDRARRDAATHLGNLTRILDRVEHEDLADLQRLVDDGYLPPEVLEQRRDQLERLRERIDGIGHVSDDGRFFGNEDGDGPLGDLQALQDVWSVVDSQRDQVPVVYGKDDAWADALPTVPNAMSMGIGGAIDQAMQEGESVATGIGRGVANVVTAGGYEGAREGWRNTVERDGFEGSWTDYVEATGRAIGTGIARAGDNTVMPLSAVTTMMDEDKTPGQRFVGAVQTVVQVVGGSRVVVSTSTRVSQGVTSMLQRGRTAPPRLPHGGRISMPQGSTERGTFVRNRLRDRGVREDLVRLVDHEVGTGSARGRTAMSGEQSGRVRVTDQAFNEGPAQVERTALHEVGHVQQGQQLRTTGPARGIDLRGGTSRLARAELELEIRGQELDAALAARSRALRQSGPQSTAYRSANALVQEAAQQRNRWLDQLTSLRQGGDPTGFQILDGFDGLDT